MTQVWPGLGEGPVPTLMSLTCRPDAVVTGFAASCAIDADEKATSAIAIRASFAELMMFTGFRSRTGLMDQVISNTGITAQVCARLSFADIATVALFRSRGANFSPEL